MKLQNAYEIISNPEKRRAYDTQWADIRDRLRAQQESDRRQAEAAETEKTRATEESAKRQKENSARQERLRLLEVFKSRYDSDIFEVSRVIRKLIVDLKRLQDQDDEDLRKERERNSWWAYLASPIYGKVNETQEQKQARETKRLHRIASKSIKGSELRENEAKLQRLQDALQNVNSKIAVEKKKGEDEAWIQMMEKKLRMEQEARNRAQQEMREKWAKIQKEQAERAAKEAREAREAQEAQERVRKAAEERAQAMRAAEEATRKAKKASGSTKSTCRHDKFWPKVEGRQLCSNCRTVQRRFAFQCPGCRMIACASCRQTLRGEKRKTFNSGQQFGFNSNDNYDADFSYYDYD